MLRLAPRSRSGLPLLAAPHVLVLVLATSGLAGCRGELDIDALLADAGESGDGDGDPSGDGDGDGDGDPSGDGDGDPSGDGDGDPSGDGDGDPSGDGDGDPSGYGDGDPSGDGDGDGEGPNLLANPSFESWAGTDLGVWMVDGGTATLSNEAVDGQRSAVVSADGYAGLSQDLEFGQPLAAGTCLAGGASIRYIDGSTTAPGFLFYVIYDDTSEELLGDGLSWSPDGEWHDATIPILPLTKPVSSLYLTLGSTTPDPHSYMIDAAFLREVACP